ncbi:MAG: peptidylprolyl isomerase [Parcubacteria group bacterium]|jgi:FKBP-type peptidyl-prolyl cis-trans isomerase|nr:peptidylprolyl isomerase [Parcubacteria group bacterium]|tara:strand:- start:8539 stop:9024 length:486 start_codon:yes stop_codon:yes gene_type:complete
MKKIIPIIIVLVVIAGGIYFIYWVTSKDKFEGIDLEADKNEQSQQEPTAPTFEQLEAVILQEGSGQAVESGNTVSVHYVGVLEDGTKFDSSVDRGQPFSFTVGGGQVIQGWDLGLVGMKIGEIRRLYIPSELGYGAAGAGGGAIPANANLIFEIQLLEISA